MIGSGYIFEDESKQLANTDVGKGQEETQPGLGLGAYLTSYMEAVLSQKGLV